MTRDCRSEMSEIDIGPASPARFPQSFSPQPAPLFQRLSATGTGDGVALAKTRAPQTCLVVIRQIGSYVAHVPRAAAALSCRLTAMVVMNTIPAPPGIGVA